MISAFLAVTPETFECLFEIKMLWLKETHVLWKRKSENWLKQGMIWVEAKLTDNDIYLQR